MAIDPAADLVGVGGVDDVVAAARKEGDGPVSGVAPARLALRRLRRNRAALAFAGLFLLIVALCLAAPLYAKHVAHTDPYENHLTEQIKIDGKLTDVVAPDGVSIGPTYGKRFFLGADDSGRDIAVRLLYGGRNVARDRLRSRAADDPLVGHVRHPLRLSRRVGRHAHLALAGHRVVVPGAAARRGPGHRAVARRAATRADHDRRRVAADPCAHHRMRLRAVHGAAAAWAGARAAREGVHRGRARAGPRADPDHVLRDPAEPLVDDRRVLPADDRQRDPARGGAVVPRRRRAAPGALVGNDDRRPASTTSSPART